MSSVQRLLAPLVATLLAAAGALAGGAARAQDFSHKDWQLACDNTRTCRAAGYQRDDAPGNAVSVLFTRDAGPGTKIEGELQLGDADDGLPHPASVRLSIAGKPAGTIALKGDTNHAELAPPVVAALLKALVGSGAIVFSNGGDTWTLSGDGAAAVLLKMDDVQGRIGTPSAIVRKGTAGEAGVLPPLPVPVVQAVLLPKLAQRDDPALAKKIVASIPAAKDCDLLHDPDRQDPATEPPALWHLDAARVLVSAPCWRAAYNTGDGYWVANAKPPYDPKLVTASGTDFDEKTGITSQEKGRGIADCLGTETWTWNGREFVHTEESTTGMCRQVMAGGAWNLPTVVARVLPARPAAK